jgi:hypothetical protein
VAVDPDALEELLDQLAAGLGIGRLCPETAEVFEHGASAVGVGSQRVEFGVERVAFEDGLGAVEVVEVVEFVEVSVRSGGSGGECRGPRGEERAHGRSIVMVEGQFIVVEASERHQHLGKHVLVESGVDLRGQVEQRAGTESLLEDIDVGEVTRLGAAEERKQLARREFERRERPARRRRSRLRAGSR